MPNEKAIQRRHEGYAAKFAAETISREFPKAVAPTDEALAECFKGCVRPAKKEEYPAIRTAFLREYGARWDAVMTEAQEETSRQPGLAASAPEALDERDTAYLAAAQSMRYEADEKPRVGDWVVYPGVGGVGQIARAWEDGVQTTHDGTFHIDRTGAMEHSGRLRPPVTARLVFTGMWEEAPAWFFHHDQWSANNAVICRIRVRVWETDIPLEGR